MYVLEAVLIAFLLIGSAYAVTTLRRSSIENTKPRDNLGRLGGDALTVLTGLSDARGSLLDLSVVEAMHCARDAAPSATDCQGKRPANLSLKLGSYLPAGAGYSLKLGNGVSSQVVYGTGTPAGEATTSASEFTPQWNMTFALPELSCYPSTADVNVSMFPMLRSRVSNLTALNLSYGGATQAIAERAPNGWWNATAPAASRPASGVLAANASGRGAPFNGSTGVTACDLNGKEGAIVAALRAAAFTVDDASVPLGNNDTFRATLTGLAGISGVTMGSAEVVVYEPVTPLPGNDTWLVAARLPLPAGNSPTISWAPPPSALYGTHVAILRVNLTVGAQPVVAQKATLVDVALPTGQVPYDPIYRALLQTWMSDWR